MNVITPPGPVNPKPMEHAICGRTTRRAQPRPNHTLAAGSRAFYNTCLTMISDTPMTDVMVFSLGGPPGLSARPVGEQPCEAGAGAGGEHAHCGSCFGRLRSCFTLRTHHSQCHRSGDGHVERECRRRRLPRGLVLPAGARTAPGGGVEEVKSWVGQKLVRAKNTTIKSRSISLPDQNSARRTCSRELRPREGRGEKGDG